MPRDKTLSSNLQEGIAKNPTTKITFLERGEYVERTFADLASDAARLSEALAGRFSDGKSAGIVADSSYRWMVHDLACLMAGIHLFSFPEKLDGVARTIGARANDIEVLFSDQKFKQLNIQQISLDEDFHATAPRERRRRKFSDHFSTVFSSGTVNDIREIPISAKGTLYPGYCTNVVEERRNAPDNSGC